MGFQGVDCSSHSSGNHRQPEHQPVREEGAQEEEKVEPDGVDDMNWGQFEALEQELDLDDTWYVDEPMAQDVCDIIEASEDDIDLREQLCDTNDEGIVPRADCCACGGGIDALPPTQIQNIGIPERIADCPRA